MRTIEVKLYQFDELNDEAKEKAREWWREGGLHYPWHDDVYVNFKEEMKKTGIEVGDIFFTGFWSQGDGACFDTEWTEVPELGHVRITLAPSRYEHEGRMRVEIDADSDETVERLEAYGEIFLESMKDKARELYRQLERDYEYLNSDESVDESIRCNEYEFLENGKRA